MAIGLPFAFAYSGAKTFLISSSETKAHRMRLKKRNESGTMSMNGANAENCEEPPQRR